MHRREELERQNANAIRLAKQKQEVARKQLEREKERLEEEQALQLEELEENRRKLAEAKLTEFSGQPTAIFPTTTCEHHIEHCSFHDSTSGRSAISDVVPTGTAVCYCWFDNASSQHTDKSRLTELVSMDIFGSE